MARDDLSSWWASSASAPKRHGTITVRELTAGPEVSKVGFGVASLPPQLVVLKKVTMKSWAAEQQLTAGDVLLELNGLQMSEMSRPQFLSLMETRPLCFKFVINPLKSRQLHESPEEEQEEGETDDAGETPPVASCSSTASASDAERADDTTLQEGQVTKTRQSLSDWYLEQEATVKDLTARKGSVSSWYLDGQRPSDGQSRLTSHHRLSASVPLTGDESELGSLLQAALEKEDLESLLQAIIKAQAEGIMADLVDVARSKASQLQQRLARLGKEAAAF